MRTPHQLLRNLALITVVLAFQSLIPDVRGQVPCATPPAQLQGQAATWKQNATVNVMIDPTFSSTQKQSINNQLSKWKNAGNANVTFRVVEPNQAGPGASQGGNPLLFIMRQVPAKGPKAQGEVGGWAVDGNRGDSTMNINPGVTDPTAFIHVVSHEMGHTFGLADCDQCAAGSSAMTEPPPGAPLNAAGGYDGPTPCDSNKVASNGNYSPPPPPPEEFGGGSCPGVECNEGSGFPTDNCAWSGGCPSGWVNTGQCCQPFILSPIVIDVDGSGFDMSDADHGVAFDFFGITKFLRLSWIAHDSTNAFLVLDRDANGTIDSGRELFGNITPQPKSSAPNGFLALAEYDKGTNGGNLDGVIDHNDAIFLLLRLWQDTNHNGFSEWWELHTLPDLKVESISLDFKESRRVDRYGNQFRYRAKVTDSKGAQLGRWAWDVFLVAQ